MRLIGTFIAITLLTSLVVSAQQLDYRSEQILLTTDRSSYTLSDTVNVKGLVTCLAHKTSLPYSNYVYLELIDPKTDSVTIRQKISCHDRGLFSSRIVLDPDFTKGIYYLRAYTNLMRNFSPESFAFRPISIGNTLPIDDGIIDENVTIYVTTAGNSLFSGLAQQLTTVITNHVGYPIANQELTLVNQTGDTIASEISSSSGYAIFNFVPQSGNSYKVVFSAMGVEKTVDAPPVNNHPKIHAVLKDRRLTFATIGDVPDNNRVFIYNRSNGLVEIDALPGTKTLNLPLKPVSPVTLFLTDDSLRIITQRSVLPKNDVMIKVEVNDTLLPGEKLDYKLLGLGTDSIRALAHIDFETLIPSNNASHSLILQSDFSSLLPFPEVTGNDTDQTELQAWLDAAKFSRFELSELFSNDSTIYRFQPETYLTINGTVFDDINGMHRMKGGQMVAYNGTDNSIYDCEIDYDGNFSVPVADFIQGTEFFLQAINSKGVIKKSITLLNDDSYPAVDIPNKVKNVRKKYSEAEVGFENSHKNQHTLPDVTVKAKVINTEKKNDKKYYGIRFKDRELIEKNNYLTLLDILRSMPTIRIRQAEKSLDGSIRGITNTGEAPSPGKAIDKNEPFTIIYVVMDTRGPASLKASMVPILIDGIKHDYLSDNSIFEYMAEDIESVEVLAPFETHMFMVKAITQVVSIKTRKLGPKAPKDAKGTRSWPSGLSPFATEFSNDIKAPDKPGNYNLIIDIVTDDGRVKTITHPITVINPGE